MAVFALFVVFLALLALGTPVALAMLASSIANIVLFGMPAIIAAERLTGAINSFPLLAIPFFILAGVIMNRGGITQRLVNVSRAFVGHFRGGTAQVNVLASIFFSGISGSASADAAAIGSMLIPAMKREGYPPGFAVGITAASATIGPIIPPSIVLIIYGSMTNMSIGALFLAGILPGLLIGIALMLQVAVMARRHNYPSAPRMPWSSRLVASAVAVPALLAPAIIIGGILGGLYTATEAGVIACLYGLFVGLFVYREFSLRDLPSIFVDAVEQTAIPVFILASAAVFGWLLTVHGFGRTVIGFMNTLDLGPTGVLIFLIVALLLVGLIVEGLAALVIFVPIVVPLIPAFGLEPLQVALIMVVTVLVGTTTPPVGLQLYIAATVGRVPITEVVIWPFVFAMVAVVVLMALIPGITTWIPRGLGF